MKDGALLGWSKEEKCLYILGQKRMRQYEISCFAKDVTPLIIMSGVDELSFYIENKDCEEEYNALQDNKYLFYEGFGEFIITEVQEECYGDYKVKNIKAYSSEYMFNKSLFTLYDKTEESDKYCKKYLWSEDESKDSVMKDILLERPSWSIGYVSESLLNKQLSFANVTQETALTFMNDSVGNNFDCIFSFDNFDRKINIYSREEFLKDTGIVFTMDNFIKAFGKDTVTEDIVTCLDVKGNNIDISRCNPTGTRKLYSFERYYDRMSRGLVQAIKNWNKLVASYQEKYTEYFAEWSNYKIIAEEKEAEWDNLQSTWMNYNDRYLMQSTEEGKEKVWQDWMNWAESSGYNGLYEQMAEADNKAREFERKLEAINDKCKMSANFTQEQLIELDDYIIEGKYEKKAYVGLKNMTEKEKGEIASQLYERAKEDIIRLNKLRFEFTTTLTNFLAVDDLDCRDFGEQLNVGKYIRIIEQDGTVHKLIVVKIEPSPSDLSEINITFSDMLNYHEDYSRLNDYLNDVYDRIQREMDEANNNLNDRLDGYDSRFDGIDGRIDDILANLGDDILPEVAPKLPIAQPISEINPEGILGCIVPDGVTINVDGVTGIATCTSTGWKKIYNKMPTVEQAQEDGIVVGDVILVLDPSEGSGSFIKEGQTS